MKRMLLAMLACAALLLAVSPWAQSAPGAGAIWQIEIPDTINPGTAEFLKNGLAKAAEADAACVVIKLDTPGGLVDSMREMVRDIMASPVPVVLFVAPAGARATSAGAFLVLAGHIAAMAPATHLGAASPVGAGGQDVGGTMAKKVFSDLEALITSIAKERGRPAEQAKAMVSKAQSFDATEAKKLGLVDIIAPDLGALLKKIAGRTVKTAAGERTIVVAGKAIHYHTPDLRERLLSILANPNLAYILLMIGMMGLYFELSNPGAIFPGVIGGVSLILAFFAMSTLPVSYAGLALLGLAVVFFVAELLVVSKGLLALGGAVSLVLGSIMLFESDEEMFRVSLSVLIPTALAVVSFFGLVTFLAIKAQVSRSATGSEGMVGLIGVVKAPGKVLVAGELWRYQSSDVLVTGQEVRVTNIDGLSLKVTPV